MLRFVVRRLAAGAVLVVVLSSFAYLLLYISAGDIARNILGQSATEETVALKKQELGLDQPLLTRFGTGCPTPSRVTWGSPGSPASR